MLSQSGNNLFWTYTEKREAVRKSRVDWKLGDFTYSPTLPISTGQATYTFLP